MTKMKRGFELTGTDNDGMRHRYSFIKKESFKKVFIKFMEDLGFDSKKIKQQFLRVIYDDCGHEIGEEYMKLSEICDVCYYYKNKKYEIDVFYGLQKIILVIRTNQKNKRDRRFNMLDYLEESSDWIEISEIKKIEEKKEQIVPKRVYKEK